jgi:cyanophycin synthetase
MGTAHMIELWRSSRLLWVCSLFDRLKAAWRGRPARGQAAERNLDAFYEKIWREAAARCGADIEPLGNNVLEIRCGDFRTRVIGNTTSLDDLVAHCLVRSKPVMYSLLAEQGLPIPRHLEFSSSEIAKAVEFLDSCPGPCVVKPACGTGGGLGVTTGIRSPWALARAAWSAARHGGTVLIEEQATGDNYRLLYLDGRLLDTVLRHPPSVVGNGRSTVAQLVDQANAERVRQGFGLAHVLLGVDMDMRHALAEQGLTLRAVPQQGRRVIVKTATNENSSRDNVSATAQVCKAVVAAGAKAAAATGIRLAGVDIITRDPTVPLEESGGLILEVNSPPGYYWHYQKRDESFPVAVHVLEALMAPMQTTMEVPVTRNGFQQPQGDHLLCHH